MHWKSCRKLIKRNDCIIRNADQCIVLRKNSVAVIERYVGSLGIPNAYISYRRVEINRIRVQILKRDPNGPIRYGLHKFLAVISVRRKAVRLQCPILETIRRRANSYRRHIITGSIWVYANPYVTCARRNVVYCNYQIAEIWQVKRNIVDTCNSIIVVESIRLVIKYVIV